MKTIEDRLREFVEYLDKTINVEYEKTSVSIEDIIRKNSYCLALQRDKMAIQNILSGNDFNCIED